MISFAFDYSGGCHPRILELMQETNHVKTAIFDDDPYCARARELIRGACQAPDADVHFIASGTLTNLTVISAALRPYEAVLSTVQAHIATNETGAIEAVGHRVITYATHDGKMKPEHIHGAFASFTSVMHTQPKMVFVSQTTELGTVYTKAEIEALARACKECGFYLYLDGARLGYALSSYGNDLTLPDIARLCDIFYIGGNKVGAMIGEAVVIVNPELKPGFRHVMKQKGALLAKGRLLGIQFMGLFENDLYLRIGKPAIDCAALIKKTCIEKGYRLLVDSPSNMLFLVLPNGIIAKLQEKYIFGGITKVDEEHRAVRILTGWDTTIEEAQAFCEDLSSVT